MRKGIIILLCLLIAGSLFAAGRTQQQGGMATRPATSEIGPHGIRYAVDQTLRRIYSTEVSNLRAFDNSISATDADFNALGQKGLISRDRYDLLAPGLAERWEINADETVYTFHIRRGLQWVDHTKTPVPGAELTADDFVAVMEWVLDPTNLSGNAHQYNRYIQNAEQYYAGEVPLSAVGFRAIDRYTLQITLNQPVPYFLQFVGFLPAYRPFLQQHYRTYGTELNTVLFIGPYVLTEYQHSFRRVWEKNPYYFRADQIHIERIVDTYNAEASLLAPELFIRGEIDYASVSADIIDMWVQDPRTRDYVSPGRPNHLFQWYYMFNFWPQFDARHQPSNWNLAVNNEAFRQSLFYGLNRLNAHLPVDPFNPEVYLQSTITPVGYANVGGVDYVDFAPLVEFSHHPTWGFDPQRALAFRDQAIRELTAQGATFPITLLMPYNPSTISWGFEVQVVAQQLVELFGPNYVRPVIEAGPTATFLAEIRREGNYAFMKGNNGGVAPEDPAAWVFAFQPGQNWNFMDLATGAQTRAIYARYVELLRAAEAIPYRTVERYAAFAAAEHHLLRHAMVIPYYTTGGGYHVYRYNFWDGFGNPSSGGLKIEGMRMLAAPMTAEQWRLLHADWQVGREAALRAQR
ncbi:MAG: ABC transporter substrate-binding protein [Treponema sp.]|nr:ABC transporter substrate-binding protein [Treponema sp.]